MNVSELIKYLETLDPDLLVGKVGHFGEFYPMETYHFSTYSAFPFTSSVLDINIPYIGEEPD
jgi:hypothetical protein